MAKLQEADLPQTSMVDLQEHLEKVMAEVDDLRKKVDNVKDRIEQQQNPLLKKRLQHNIDTRLQVALDKTNQEAADIRAQIEVIEKATHGKKRDASELGDSDDSEDSDDDTNRPVKKQKATHDAADSEAMMSEAPEATTRKIAVPKPKVPSTANAKKVPSTGPSSTGNRAQQTMPAAPEFAKLKLTGAWPAEDQKSSSKPRPSAEEMAKRDRLDALIEAELTFEHKKYALPKKLPKPFSESEIKAKKKKEEEMKKDQEKKKRKERARMLEKLKFPWLQSADDSDSDSDEEEEEEEDDTSRLAFERPPEWYTGPTESSEQPVEEHEQDVEDDDTADLWDENATPKPSGITNPPPPYRNTSASEKPKEKPKTYMNLHLPKIEGATPGNANASSLPVNRSPLYAPRPSEIPRSLLKQKHEPKEKPKTSMNLHLPKIEEAAPEPSGNANPPPPPVNPSPQYAPSGIRPSPYVPKTSMNLHMPKVEDATPKLSRNANSSPHYASSGNTPPPYVSPYANPRESIKQKEKPKNPMHSNIPKKEESPTIEVPKNTSRVVKNRKKSPTLNAASIAANLSHTPDVDPKFVAKTPVTQILGEKYVKKYSWMVGQKPADNPGTKHTPIVLDEEGEKETAGTQAPIQEVKGASDANVQNNLNDVLLYQEGAPATQNHNAEDNGNDIEADLEEAFAEDKGLDRQRQLEEDRTFEEAFEKEEEETQPENTSFCPEYQSADADRTQNHEYGPDVEVWDFGPYHGDNTPQLRSPQSEGLSSAGNMSQRAEPIEKVPYRQWRNKKELQAECKSRGLHVGGNFDTLVARLEENDHINAQSMTAGSTPNQLLSPQSEGLATTGNKRQSGKLIENQSYNSQTVDELKAILRARKLHVKGNKPDLITRLEEDDLKKSQEVAAGSTLDQLFSPESEGLPTSEETYQPAQQLYSEAPVDYSSWKVPALKAAWKVRGIKGANRKYKPELVARLEADDRERSQEMVANPTLANQVPSPESEQTMLSTPKSTVARPALANVTNTKSQKAPVQSNAKKVSSGRVEKPKPSRGKPNVDEAVVMAMLHEAQRARPSAPASNFDLQKALSMASANHTPGPTVGRNPNSINEFTTSQPAQSRPRVDVSNGYATGAPSMVPANYDYSAGSNYTPAPPAPPASYPPSIPAGRDTNTLSLFNTPPAVARSQIQQVGPRAPVSIAYASGSSSMVPGNHPPYTSHAGSTPARSPTFARPQTQKTSKQIRKWKYGGEERPFNG